MIEFHADDYGMFPAQSKRIRKCIEEGVLNGISIMPNSPYLAECMEALQPVRDKVRIAVHLNFLHGKALSCPEEIPHLVRQDGTFHISYVKALLASFYPGMRSVYRQEFKKEIRRQLKAVEPYMKQGVFRIDSHVHYHVIPVVFDALMEALEEECRQVGYIRMPAEPIQAFFRCRSSLSGIPWLNVVKSGLLKALTFRNRIKYRKRLDGITVPFFYGVLYSGRMTYQNVTALLDDFKRHYPGERAEFLFHPGAVYEAQDWRELNAASDRVFLTSPLRDKEAEALIRLHEAS